MKHFDYSFLRGRVVGSDMLGRLLKLNEFRLRMNDNKKQYGDAFIALESIARVQSVKGSNAIEGIVTSDERIDAIVNRNVSPKGHDEMEIAGYRDALDAIHNGHGAMDISEATILGLHGIMMSYLPGGSHGYKGEDNLIIDVDRDGKRSVRFRPTPASETKNAMEQMILAYIEARDDLRIDPLLLIPCFILDFLCIHPFSDGNGRMSRLLSLLMMYRSGLDVGKYISFEEQINRSKERYYDALKRSSAGWHDDSNDYVPFMDDFIGTLYLCYKELDRRFAMANDKPTKTDRIESIVMNSILPISKREICELLPDISQTTVESVLSGMLREGSIKKIGSNRNARYLRNR